MSLKLFAPPLVLVFVLSIIALSLQDPPPVPTPIHFDCTSPTRSTLKVGVDLDQDPIEALRILISQVTPVSTDTIKPVIASVIYSGGADVLTGNVKIQAAANGVPFTVKAGDDIGVVRFQLWVDGRVGPSDGDGIKPLPFPFYVRWNDASTTPGPHAFKLQVYDAGHNVGEANWSMTR